MNGKYRGWTVDTNKEVKGYYVVYGDGSHCIVQPVRETISEEGGSFVRNYEVIPETIGQFTGLLDKERSRFFPHGKEIYEGDIVEINGAKYICEHTLHSWSSEFRFWILPHKKWCDGSMREKEVIGNIHENGGLLNGQ